MTVLAGARDSLRSAAVWRSSWSRDWERRAAWSLVSLVVLVSWGGGGVARWNDVCLLGGSAWLVAVGCAWRGADEEWRQRAAAWLRALWPWWVFNALALASLVNPLFEVATLRGRDVLLVTESWPFWPGTTRVTAAAWELWRWNVTLLVPLSAFLFIRSERTWLRVLLGIGLAALVLAVWGTLVRLSGLPDYFGGLLLSPSDRFFAQFIYPNHWAAFALLQLGLWAAVLHAGRPPGDGDEAVRRWLLPLVAIALLWISVVVSGSRSGTLLAGAWLVLAGWFAWRRARRGGTRLRRWMTIGGAVLGVVLLIGVWTGRKEVAARVALTRLQVAEALQVGAANSRLILYRDTLRMTAARPLTGWGLGSYALVFPRFNSQWAEDMGAPVNYRNAHSDWLQLLAECGVVGGVLILLTLRAILVGVGPRAGSEPSRQILLGLGVLAVQAMFDFPVSNFAVAMLAATCVCAAVIHRGIATTETVAFAARRS